MQTITKTLIPDLERLDFLTHRIGSGHLDFEHHVHRWMGLYCQGYEGGEWAFYALSNGSFLMTLQRDKPFFVVCEGKRFAEFMTPEGVSIGVNLLSLARLAWHTIDNVPVMRAYYALRDFAAAHRHGAQILRLIA